MKSLAHVYSKIEILETTSELAWGGEIGLWCLMPLSTIFQLDDSG